MNICQNRPKSKSNIVQIIESKSNDFGIDPALLYSDVCQTLSPKEKNLHEFLKALGKLVGFKDTENVSLHDLPAMLSSNTDINWPPVMGHLFLFSLCEDHYDSNQDYNYYSNSGITSNMFNLHASCLHEWNQYFQGRLPIQNTLYID